MDRNVKSWRIGDFLLQGPERQIRRGEESWPLTPKPFGVLMALATNAGEVVSREDLLKSVWTGVQVTPDAVERCIRELRNILGDNSRNPRIIETIHGVGYRLIAPVEPVTRTGFPRRNFAFRKWLLRAAPALLPVCVAGWWVGVPAAEPFSEV